VVSFETLAGMGKLTWVFVQRWWAYMSCAVWTALSAWQLVSNKKNATWLEIYAALAVVSLIFALGRTAYEEHKGRIGAEKKLDTLRPRLTLLVIKDSHSWFKYEHIFTLRHLGGEPAQYIQVQPILSAIPAQRPGITVKFHQVDFLDSSHKEESVGYVFHIGNERCRPEDHSNLRYIFFQRDSEKLTGFQLDYPIVIRFKWDSEWLEQKLILNWYPKSGLVTISPSD
jgi:hypothetical protein